MLTRVGTFSVILIIDRSRTPGRLQPLGSFLFTGVAVKELTDLLHLFVTGFVKNTLTTVFNTSRITFTDLTFRVIVKVLPQIQRRQWWQKRNLFICYGSNFQRHFVCWSFPRRCCKKMRARVTRGGQNVLKIVHLMAMIYIPMMSTPSLEKVSSYGCWMTFFTSDTRVSQVWIDVRHFEFCSIKPLT